VLRPITGRPGAANVPPPAMLPGLAGHWDVTKRDYIFSTTNTTSSPESNIALVSNGKENSDLRRANISIIAAVSQT
jgi:hypothetical protein